MMRKIRRNYRAGFHKYWRRHHFMEDNDPLFDERDLDYCAAGGDDKIAAQEK